MLRDEYQQVRDWKLWCKPSRDALAADFRRIRREDNHAMARMVWRAYRKTVARMEDGAWLNEL